MSAVINELSGENIDIIEWDEDPSTFIGNALSPAKVLSVEVDEEERTAIVDVREDQLSLAIGRKGQNVRLAAKLSGWKIDVRGADAALEDEEDIEASASPEDSAVDADSTESTNEEDGEKEEVTPNQTEEDAEEEADSDEDQDSSEEERPEEDDNNEDEKDPAPDSEEESEDDDEKGEEDEDEE